MYDPNIAIHKSKMELIENFMFMNKHLQEYGVDILCNGLAYHQQQIAILELKQTKTIKDYGKINTRSTKRV